MSNFKQLYMMYLFELQSVDYEVSKDKVKALNKKYLLLRLLVCLNFSCIRHETFSEITLIIHNLHSTKCSILEYPPGVVCVLQVCVCVFWPEDDPDPMSVAVTAANRSKVITTVNQYVVYDTVCIIWFIVKIPQLCDDSVCVFIEVKCHIDCFCIPATIYEQNISTACTLVWMTTLSHAVRVDNSYWFSKHLTSEYEWVCMNP